MVILDVEILHGVEDASGMEEEEEKDCHKAQPVDIVETLRFGCWLRFEHRRRICAHGKNNLPALIISIFFYNDNLLSQIDKESAFRVSCHQIFELARCVCAEK